MKNSQTKKLAIIMLTITLCLITWMTPFSVMAETTASVTGPGVVRTGDTITISIKMNGAGVVSVQGEIQYDANLLTYKNSAGALAGWTMDIDGSAAGKITFLGIDNALTAPINTNSQLFTVSFQVKDAAASGSNITITAANLKASDGTSDFAPGNAAYSVNVAAPLSGNTFLSRLTIDNGTLAPAFSKNVYAYSVSVPFSVEKLNVTALTEDANSKTAISSPALAPGTTTQVTVTVTAQTGAKKTYTIAVSREKDPNYKAGSNANLKSFKPDNGILSPVFSPDVTEYVIYLPYEITTFNATGEMEDAKAQGASGTEIQLEPGANQFKMTGKAEDGTEKVYTITVNRMPLPGSSIPDTTSSSGTEVFRMTLSGTLTDGQGNPLADKTIELHSDPRITTTDATGFYTFENVEEGSHTIYVKEKDGTELAQLSFAITKGDQTSVQGNEIIAKGDTTMDLLLNDGLTIKNAAETKISYTTVTKGVPVYGAILLMLVAMIIGGIISYFILLKRYSI